MNGTHRGLQPGGIQPSPADPFAIESIVNAQREDSALRELAPAVYFSRYDMIGIFRYAAVKAILGDWRVFSSKDRPFNDAMNAVPQILVTDDPPEHGRIRAILMQFFTPVQMQAVRDRFVVVAERIVDQALAFDGNVDIVDDIARPFIMDAFPDMLGLPENGRSDLLMFGEAVFNGVGPRTEFFYDSMKRCEPGFRWVMENTTRDKVAPGGLAARTYELADKGEITSEEADLLVKTMLGAGFDTTIASISNCLYAMAANPDQWELLHSDPTLARRAFEEGMRFDPPARMMGRVVTEDADVQGISFKKGDKIGLFLNAACRDPARYDNPEQFDITRTLANIGFGSGIHQCLGQALARLEGEVLLSVLARRVKRIEPAGPGERLINNNIQAWTKAPVRLHAA